MAIHHYQLVSPLEVRFYFYLLIFTQIDLPPVTPTKKVNSKSLIRAQSTVSILDRLSTPQHHGIFTLSL